MEEKSKRTTRPDQNGTHRRVFEQNKKKIYATQNECALCGQPIDFTIKFPEPLSPCIDHIIPVAKGGHPSDIDNLQLTHLTCNRQKSDRILPAGGSRLGKEIKSNRNLPQSIDWRMYKST